MLDSYFVTGISTDVGKTVVSAIITEALQADYWKPIQAGDLDNSDTINLKRWVTNPNTQFHNSVYNLHTPMSPHAAAQIDKVQISANKLARPKTKNRLVIEGAGGLLVPLNNSETVLDLIHPADKVIVVSKHYLGSINHTLLTVEALKARKFDVFGIVFNGPEHSSTESIIQKMTGVKVLGRIEEEPFIDRNVVNEYAAVFSDILSPKKRAAK